MQKIMISPNIAVAISSIKSGLGKMPPFLSDDAGNFGSVDYKDFIKRVYSHYLLRKLLKIRYPCNIRICHSKTGKPYTSNLLNNLSISHKDGFIMVGVSQKDIEIGVDIEDFGVYKNTNLFLRYSLDKSERKVLLEFSKNRHLLISDCVKIFWTVKESFFKCIDAPLKPLQLKILGISDNNGVEVIYLENPKIFRKRLSAVRIMIGYTKKYCYSITTVAKT